MNLIDRLTAATAGQSAAATAAQLGISKQAYAQARARRRLSEPAALRAAELLGIEPGAALLANATRQDPTPPVSNATSESVCNAPTTNYAKFRQQKKGLRRLRNRSTCCSAFNIRRPMCNIQIPGWEHKLDTVNSP